MVQLAVQQLPEVATRDEVACFTRISKPTLARWAVEGKGPTYRKAGGRVLYRREDVLAWLESLDMGGSAGLANTA
ncbi:helix-turn-helix transcriptional regulator [Microbacterium sp. HMH0099]|uniref:helix-turn-helix transcriptional regulator n=1 Tax=Microbacterium sp. HMH0099 TaxID=3414026 RepID=UPI003BF66D33